MRSGWQTKTLGELCQIERGGSPRPIDSFLTNDSDGINWIKIGDAKNGSKYIFETEEKIRPEGAKRSRMVSEGDFVLSNSMSFGRPYIMKTSGCIHDGWLVLRQPEGAIDQDYLYYVLSSDLVFRQFDRLAAGSTVRNLNIGLAKQVAIPFPNLTEQKRIVAILDKAFAAIATAKAYTEKNLLNARSLFLSYLDSAFTNRGPGWVERSVGQISQHSLGKMLDKAKNQGTPRPYLRNLNVRWFEFDLSDLLEMRFLPNETAKYTAAKGDVLVCEGGYPGRAAIWNEDHPIYFQKAIHRVRFHEPEHAKWFVFFLYAQDASDQLRTYFTGAGIQHFTGEALDRLLVPIPPLVDLRTHVRRFQSLLDQIQQLESLWNERLTRLSEQKQSLLNQAFSGTL